MANTFKQIKEYLHGLVPIKLEGIDERPTDNIKEFITLFFNEYNQQHRTVFASNGRLQTEPGKRRSFGDIYRIVHFYFPRITVTTVYETLYQLIAEDIILSAICAVNETRVYRKLLKRGEHGTVNSVLMDEFGTDLTIYVDKFKCRKHTGDGWGNGYTEENLRMIKL